MGNEIERLVAAGISREDAKEAVIWFCGQGTAEGLESYVLRCERRFDEEQYENRTCSSR